MSEERLKRRRFLADALFAGGALGAAALTARYFTRPAEPEPPMPGAVAVPPELIPSASPTCVETPPGIDGDVVAPMPSGRVAAPSRSNP